ncbi:hypothetical protein VCHENC02_4330 [Vibrio harveyi]|uniref:Uncharacterized protein n=1 Tax=Vibrio harveyi TaxID=669 RepID=A0A454CU15_VIBHA|nr:hypothetical protein VCHENC02_4330 [Vibrio harveyi]
MVIRLLKPSMFAIELITQDQPNGIKLHHDFSVEDALP